MTTSLLLFLAALKAGESFGIDSVEFLPPRYALMQITRHNYFFNQLFYVALPHRFVASWILFDAADPHFHCTYGHGEIIPLLQCNMR
jgi:hypothetical protein